MTGPALDRRNPSLQGRLLNVTQRHLYCDVLWENFELIGSLVEEEEDTLEQLKSYWAHSSEHPFMCGECGMDFQASFGLSQQQAAHSMGKLLSSTRETFPHSSIRQHPGVHTGQKPFKCNNCGKSFLESSQDPGIMT
ncbi:zinc finger protein 883-like [Ailuropoda melanoleuca]|uniref:zinc finger protein 883-like n=1 Tax=Ailuropoda melanoleuca TaxID=9646 RepID=UPI00059ADB36|nr:zinc finger protein 883-like [Ailuropoda melanoleuca]